MMQNTPARHGEPWSNEEDNRLIHRLVEAQLTVQCIAELHRRTVSGILMRIDRLKEQGRLDRPSNNPSAPKWHARIGCQYHPLKATTDKEARAEAKELVIRSRSAVTLMRAIEIYEIAPPPPPNIKRTTIK